MRGSRRREWAILWLATWLLVPAGVRANDQVEKTTKVLIAHPGSRFISAKRLRGLADEMHDLAGQYGRLEVVSEGVDPPSCDRKGRTCWLALAKRLGAEQLIWVHFQKLPFRFVVLAQVVRVEDGKIVAHYRRRLRGRPRNLKNLIRKAWAHMFGPTVEVFVRVTANTLGAEVVLNGKIIGKAPVSVTRTLGAGQHWIAVRHPGFLEQKKVLLVKPGERQHALRFDLVRDKPLKPVVAAAVEVGEKTTAPKPPVVKAPVVKPAPPALPEAGPDPIRPSAVEVETIEPRPVELDGPLASGSPEDQAPAGSGVYYEQWWFWTSVAAALVAGLTTTVLLGSEGKDVIPVGKGRVTFEF